MSFRGYIISLKSPTELVHELLISRFLLYACLDLGVDLGVGAEEAVMSGSRGGDGGGGGPSWEKSWIRAWYGHTNF